MLRNTTLTVAIAVFAACSDGIGPEAEFLVQERWEWVSACCGIAGNEITPASEGVSSGSSATVASWRSATTQCSSKPTTPST